jgi:hypothetical protein
MPKNNLISQFLILNLAFLTNFAIEKIGQCQRIHLDHATWSPNESYHAVDQVIWATHRRPHISCSDKSNLSQWNFPAWWSMWRGKLGAPWVTPEVLGFTWARAHAKGPEKGKPCMLSDTSQQHANLCFNIEQWKTTSCLPSKPCIGWLLDFVITSWCEFLKISTFKQPGIWVFIKRLKISAGSKF